MLYQLGRPAPKLLLVPTDDEKWNRKDYDNKPATAEFDVGPWMGGTYDIDRVDNFPGTRCKLKNGYDIVVLSPLRKSSRTGPRAQQPGINSAVRALFGCPWRGNILVLKRGVHSMDHIVNMTQDEISLVNSLVQRYASSSVLPFLFTLVDLGACRAWPYRVFYDELADSCPVSRWIQTFKPSRRSATRCKYTATPTRRR